MLNCILSIIPIALYLVILYLMDEFMLARRKMLVSLLVWGVVSFLIMYGIVVGYRALGDGQPWTSPWISPVLEEVLKFIPLLILIYRGRIAFYAETLIYGQVVGGGFALAENILYVSTYPDMTAGTALVRGFDTALMHMGCTALLGSLVLIPVLYWSQHKCSTAKNTALVFAGLLMFIPSILIHYIHNLNLMPAYAQVMVVVVCFFILFTLIEAINMTLIVNWMDVSLNEHIRLLQSIKDGNLMNSNAGKYLQAIRYKFDRIVFFDMCVYVSLYLELLIAAKSQMMLHEAGMEKKLSPEETEAIAEKKAELIAIAKRIPRSAHHLLRPIIHSSNQNKWAIEHL